MSSTKVRFQTVIMYEASPSCLLFNTTYIQSFIHTPEYLWIATKESHKCVRSCVNIKGTFIRHTRCVFIQWRGAVSLASLYPCHSYLSTHSCAATVVASERIEGLYRLFHVTKLSKLLSDAEESPIYQCFKRSTNRFLASDKLLCILRVHFTVAFV